MEAAQSPQTGGQWRAGQHRRGQTGGQRRAGQHRRGQTGGQRRKNQHRRGVAPAAAVLSGGHHGRRSLARYSPRGRRELDTTQQGTKNRETLLICQGPRTAASSPRSAEARCCLNKTARDVLVKPVQSPCPSSTRSHVTPAASTVHLKQKQRIQKGRVHRAAHQA